jgi:hypothetical protein
MGNISPFATLHASSKVGGVPVLYAWDVHPPVGVLTDPGALWGDRGQGQRGQGAQGRARAVPVRVVRDGAEGDHVPVAGRDVRGARARREGAA